MLNGIEGNGYVTIKWLDKLMGMKRLRDEIIAITRKVM